MNKIYYIAAALCATQLLQAADKDEARPLVAIHGVKPAVRRNSESAATGGYTAAKKINTFMSIPEGAVAVQAPLRRQSASVGTAGKKNDTKLNDIAASSLLMARAAATRSATHGAAVSTNPAADRAARLAALAAGGNDNRAKNLEEFRKKMAAGKSPETPKPFVMTADEIAGQLQREALAQAQSRKDIERLTSTFGTLGADLTALTEEVGNLITQLDDKKIGKAKIQGIAETISGGAMSYFNYNVKTSDEEKEKLIAARILQAKLNDQAAFVAQIRVLREKAAKAGNKHKLIVSAIDNSGFLSLEDKKIASPKSPLTLDALKPTPSKADLLIAMIKAQEEAASASATTSAAATASAEAVTQ